MNAKIALSTKTKKLIAKLSSLHAAEKVKVIVSSTSPKLTKRSKFKPLLKSLGDSIAKDVKNHPKPVSSDVIKVIEGTEDCMHYVYVFKDTDLLFCAFEFVC